MTITMNKLHYFFTFAFVLLAFTSCLDDAVMSPGFAIVTPLERTSQAGVKDTVLLSDTLLVGDTVRAGVVLNGYYDYLTSFIVSADESKVRCSLAWDEEDSMYLAEDANPEIGKLTFAPQGVYACYTTLQYVPQDSGLHKIEMVLTSAAENPYTTASGHFFIVAKKP